TLSVVSLANPAAPALETSFDLAGTYVGSRLVGDVLYAVTDQGVTSFGLGVTVTQADAATLPHGGSVVQAGPGVLAVAGAWDWNDDTTPLDLVDVSDPAGAIALRGGLVLDGFVSDSTRLHVAGARAFAVTHSFTDSALSRLATIDLSDLDAPAVLGEL